MSCLFCRIAASELPSAQVAENDTALAFLDINPVQPGHTLVVPKAHAAKVADMTEGDSFGLWRLAHQLLPALAAVTGAPDATLAIHDGPAAGQEIPHVHLHVIPRKTGDGGGPVHALFANPIRPDSEELNDLAIRIQARLGP